MGNKSPQRISPQRLSRQPTHGAIGTTCCKDRRKDRFLCPLPLPPAEGIFFEGQIFDAYVFTTNLIKSARKTIILIDNYVDENTLLMLSKRNEGVKTTLYTAKLNKQLQLE